MSVLILMYHGVEPRPGPLFVEPELFAEHVAVIAASGLPVLTVGEVGDLLRDGRLPERAVALTFDDGFASVVDEAAPLLLEHGLRATVFCVAGRLGGMNDWPTNPRGTPRAALASAADLSRIANAGFEIGGHGMDHSPLHSDDPAEIHREIPDARAALEQAVDAPVRSLAYPYGRAPSPVARRAVAETYEVACTTRVGRVQPNADALALQRVDVHYLRSPKRLARAIRGESNGYLALRRLGADVRRSVIRDYSSRTD
jgi:peptidoglycan/xylan/chitin deacetylase (PgdA/CDA1 family)